MTMAELLRWKGGISSRRFWKLTRPFVSLSLSHISMRTKNGEVGQKILSKPNLVADALYMSYKIVTIFWKNASFFSALIEKTRHFSTSVVCRRTISHTAELATELTCLLINVREIPHHNSLTPLKTKLIRIGFSTYLTENKVRVQ
jgi:hypothetical protein